jgi:hypothetical protein
MRTPVRWVAMLGLAGLLIGGVYGFLVARTIDCVVDGADLPANATCYHVLGLYLSSAAYHTAAAAAIGASIGVMLGLFIVNPILLWRRQDRSTRMHVLEHPVIWLGLQLVELIVLIPTLLFWIPDPGVWPEGIRIGVWVVALVGVTAVNYAIRRRFIPR